MDGNEISAADPNTQKVVEFDFKAGAILMLRDEGGNSVIQFTKFTILNCGTFHNTNLWNVNSNSKDFIYLLDICTLFWVMQPTK